MPEPTLPEPDPTAPPRVFVSYAHDPDNPAHADRVLALADALRADNIEAALDQYDPNPAEGWPQWMERNLDAADFVLLICTPAYLRRVTRREPAGVGLGVHWEGNIIYNRLYRNLSQGDRYIPVLLDGADAANIPTPVQGSTFYRLGTFGLSDAAYEALYRHLTGQHATPAPALGTRKVLPPEPRGGRRTLPSPSGPGGHAVGGLWMVPQAQNPFFTGRDEVLRALRVAFGVGGPPRALSGLGGVGKTQTAVEYAYRHRQDYQAVLWAQADSAQTLLAAFAQIAATLGLPEAGAQDLDQTRAAVTRWLAEAPGYLLVLDNADDPAALKPFLPPRPAGHILLTSRKRDLAVLHIEHSVDLLVLPSDEAVAFLLRRTDREGADPTEHIAAAELAGALGDLPLALEQAGAYIAVQQSRFTDYLVSYRRRALDLLEKQGPVTGDYDKTVATTWSLNFEAVQAASEASAELLRVSAFLAPDRIPEELLLRGAPALGETLAAALAGAGEDRLLLDELLEPLARYSLIRRDIEVRNYSIHRLVQAVIRHEMNDTTSRNYAERIVRAVTKSFPDPEFSNWLLCEQLLPHARACVTHLADYNLEILEATRLLNDLGLYLDRRHQYAEAEATHKQALSIRERLLGSENPHTALSLNNLALTYGHQGRFKEALPLQERVVLIRERFLGAEDNLTAAAINNLASLNEKLGFNEKALLLYRQALSIRKRSLGMENPSTALSFSNLGSFYGRYGNFAKAQAFLKRALNIYEKHREPGHPDVILTLNNLASLYKEQGRYGEALPLFQQALDASKKSLGSEDQSTAAIIRNLATLYFDQGDPVAAELLLKQALYIYDKKLGGEHYETVETRDMYAYVLSAMEGQGQG